jgi:hypothetical protein
MLNSGAWLTDRQVVTGGGIASSSLSSTWRNPLLIKHFLGRDFDEREETGRPSVEDQGRPEQVIEGEPGRVLAESLSLGLSGMAWTPAGGCCAHRYVVACACVTGGSLAMRMEDGGRRTRRIKDLRVSAAQAEG